MRNAVLSLLMCCLTFVPLVASARGSSEHARMDAHHAAIAQWLRAPYATALPEALRPAWSRARFEIKDRDPKEGCVKVDRDEEVVTVNARCASADDLAQFESGAARVSRTRLQWELFVAATGLWAKRAPLYADEKTRDEIAAERFFDTGRTLLLDVDQEPSMTFIEFWARAVYAQLLDADGASLRPRLYKFLARTFFTPAEAASFRVPADLDARAETDRYQLHAKAHLLIKGAEGWWARYQMIRMAKKSIRTGYFTVWKTDAFGRAFLALLMQKAREGVDVELIVDGRGYWNTHDDYLQELVAAGGKVRVYNPILNSHFSILGSITSYHDKILLVDNKYYINGGRNIGDRYFIQPDESPNRVYWDTDVVYELDRTPVELLYAFNREYYNPVAKPVHKERWDWSDKEPELMASLHAMEDRMTHEQLSAESLRTDPELDRMKSIYGIQGFTLFPDQTLYPIEILDNTSRYAEQNELTDRVFYEIDHAQDEIVVQNPYLVLTPQAKTHLAAAAQRGVKVRFSITTPMSTDSYFTQSILSFEWQNISREIPGCEINGAVGPQQLHAKIFVFDRKKSLVGSYNMDSMSQNRNSEISTLVSAPAFAQQVWDGIEEHIEQRSVRFHPETGVGPEQIEGSQARIDMLKTYYSIARWFRPLL